jgi:hypothetical protein
VRHLNPDANASDYRDPKETSHASSSDAHGSAAQAGGGNAPSRGGITRNVIRGAAGSDPSHLDGIAASNVRQITALRDLYASGRATIEHHPDWIIGEGSEHIVEHSQDPARVFKHTKPPSFGFILQPHIAPFGSFATVRHATSLEYLDRIDNFSAAFGMETCLEGVSEIGGHVRLVV